MEDGFQRLEYMQQSVTLARDKKNIRDIILNIKGMRK
jgi:hypothetical protein